jgi:hypothetical protein
MRSTVPPSLLVLFMLLALGLGFLACLPSEPAGGTGGAAVTTTHTQIDAGAALVASTGDDGTDPGAVAGDDAADLVDDDASLPVIDPPSMPDAALEDAPPEGAPDEASTCAGAPGPGDLVIVELMVESTSGAGDHGEWLEVQSTVACNLDLRGLHAEATVGAKVYAVDVSDDLWLPAGGTFVLADSIDPAVNHRLPGLVLAWTKSPGDVLRNQGGTVTLLARGALVDSVTYPAAAASIGASLAFPADCAASDRATWSAWQRSSASWFPGFYGTPNAPNTDVGCPADGG